MKSFKEKVLSIVARIPKGSVLTYKQAATLAGNPKAAHAVGMILSRNYDSKIPCHRVVRSDGQAGGYNRGARNKIRKLRQEGAKV